MQLDELSGRRQDLDLDHIFRGQGLWRHYAFHSRFARPQATELRRLLAKQLGEGKALLQQAEVLILTFGTAYGYRLRETGKWVSNCHKQDAKLFVRERASLEQMVQALSDSLTYIRNIRPELQVLLTVSPVRHLRDGLIDNQRSKALLVLSCEALSTQLAYVHYFPAYEYLLDDLRDYRFYGPDMLHPSPVAVDYIWKHFTTACWSAQTRALASRIEKLVQAAEHRPLHRSSEAFQRFQQQQREAIYVFQKEYPDFDFSRELSLLTSAKD